MLFLVPTAVPCAVSDQLRSTDDSRGAERRTWAVIAITAVAMVGEIVVGWAYNSMALLADGWHMAGHVGALGITAFAYVFARRHSQDPRFSYGTGKVGVLGGYTNAIILGVVAVIMAFASFERLLAPVAIGYDEALGVAVLGLLVNLLCAWLLAGADHTCHAHGHSQSHAHGHSQSHAHGHSESPKHSVSAEQPEGEHHRACGGHHEPAPASSGVAAQHGEPCCGTSGSHSSADSGVPVGAATHDHNLRAALFHVITDALTSVFAIIALLVAKYFDWVWADPIMGLIGTAVIVRWSWALLRDTAHILLDGQEQSARLDDVRNSLEGDGEGRVVDLHLWRLSPRHVGAVVAMVSHDPRSADHYKEKLASIPGLSHVTVEVNTCRCARGEACQIEPRTVVS